MTTDLLDALVAHRGLVCLVGAGGKKTTLYRLAGEHPGRVGITATVHTALFPKSLGAEEIIDVAPRLSDTVVAAAARRRRGVFYRPRRKRSHAHNGR